MRPQPDTERVTKTLCESCAPYRRNLSTGGGNRTHTGLPPEDFKSSASAIPPRRQDSLSSKAVDRQSKSRQLDLILASRQHASKAGQGARTFVALLSSTFATMSTAWSCAWTTNEGSSTFGTFIRIRNTARLTSRRSTRKFAARRNIGSGK